MIKDVFVANAVERREFVLGNGYGQVIVSEFVVNERVVFGIDAEKVPITIRAFAKNAANTGSGRDFGQALSVHDLTLHAERLLALLI